MLLSGKESSTTHADTTGFADSMHDDLPPATNLKGLQITHQQAARWVPVGWGCGQDQGLHVGW